MTGATQAEIVIIGAGGAGMAADLAHDIFAVESPVQKRAWFQTSRDDAFKLHMDWTHWTVDPRIVRAFIDRSADS